MSDKLKPGTVYWGHSEEPDGSWRGAYLTREAAICEGRAEYSGREFWVCGGPAIVPRIDADMVLSHVADIISENAQDDLGPDIDDPVFVSSSHVSTKHFQEMLDLWCSRYVSVRAWQADREPEHVTT